MQKKGRSETRASAEGGSPRRRGSLRALSELRRVQHAMAAKGQDFGTPCARMNGFFWRPSFVSFCFVSFRLAAAQQMHAKVMAKRQS
eukprot:scaffold7066_cov253-Pinguiococcus_pyrenoidosus.AAC.6